MRCVAEQRFVGHVTCLFQESTPAVPFGNSNSKHPLPARSRFARAASHSTSSALCLHYASKRFHLFVEDSGFVSYAEKHRFGHGVVVSKVCYGILECVFSHWPCRLLQCVEIELLATAGWKCGCQPVSCRCSQNVTHCRTEICSTCLFKESIRAIPFWDFQASTPYQKQVPERGRTLHHVCIRVVMPIPSLHLQTKDLSIAEKQSVWSRSCGLQDLLQYSDCALSCAM